MKIDTKVQGHDTIRRVLDTPHRTEATTTNLGRRLRLSVTMEEFTLGRGSDGRWRWSWVSVYGQTTGVWGNACDASGFPIHDPALADDLDLAWETADRRAKERTI